MASKITLNPPKKPSNLKRWQNKPLKYQLKLVIRKYHPALLKIDPYITSVTRAWIFLALWVLGIVLFCLLEVTMAKLPLWSDKDIFTTLKAAGLLISAISLLLGLVNHRQISVLSIALGLGALLGGEFGQIAADFSESKVSFLKTLVQPAMNIQIVFGGLTLAALILFFYFSLQWIWESLILRCWRWLQSRRS